MLTRSILLMLAAALAAGTAIAHSGVTNAAVMTRMHNMKDSAAALKRLGEMAKGATPFDAGSASDARLQLISLSQDVPALFEAPETDPLMEARPELWESWEDFVERAEMSTAALRALDVTDLASLRSGLQPVGAACSACHEAYRVEN
ncbi:MAG: cytochrome c [Pseudomonadota bacterium]